MNYSIRPVLYILLRSYRTDLPSCNTGKVAAQASHASNSFVNKLEENKELANSYICKDITNYDLYNVWKNETQYGFGTVITLESNKKDIYSVIEKVVNMRYICGFVRDPSYPYVVDRDVFELIPEEYHTLSPIFTNDGKVVCHRSELTCGYVFTYTDDSTINEIISNLSLHA